MRSDCCGAITETIFLEFLCLDDGNEEVGKADRFPFDYMKIKQENQVGNEI